MEELDERTLRTLNRNKIDVDKQFWIDTYGKIYKYTGDLSVYIVSFHSEIANELFPDVPNPGRYIEKLGWILVGSTVYSSPIITKKPTQSQINVLDQLGLLNKLCILDNGYYVNYINSENC